MPKVANYKPKKNKQAMGDQKLTLKDIEQWYIEENTINVDNTIDTSKFDRVANLKCTYVDLINYFGEPKKMDSPDRRIQWGFIEKETGVSATIYDDNSGEFVSKEIEFDDILIWAVGGITGEDGRMKDRAFEIVAQIFVQKSDEGKNFISKPIENDEEESI